jgi:preprotein translocase subunit SecE
VTQVAKKTGFFTIHKPGQGKWVRWGTVAGLGLVAAAGAYWLGMQQGQIVAAGPIVRALVALGWLAVWAFFIFWFVSTPRWAEFMIMTESEMRKVSWPSRREVVNSTKVVIILTFAMGVLLWVVDIGFIKLFQWIKIY